MQLRCTSVTVICEPATQHCDMRRYLANIAQIVPTRHPRSARLLKGAPFDSPHFTLQHQLRTRGCNLSTAVTRVCAVKIFQGFQELLCVVCDWVVTMSDMNTIQSGIISGLPFASSLHSGCHGLIRGKKSRPAPNLENEAQKTVKKPPVKPLQIRWSNCNNEGEGVQFFQLFNFFTVGAGGNGGGFGHWRRRRRQVCG